MKKESFVPLYILSLLFLSCGQEKEQSLECPAAGWIPSYIIEEDSSWRISSSEGALIATAEAAAIIAKAAVTSIYDEECAESEQPYMIRSNPDTWVVSGSLPDGYVGGTFSMAIRKDNGKIEHFYHEK